MTDSFSTNPITKEELSKDKLICPVCGKDLVIDGMWDLVSSLQLKQYAVVCPDADCSFSHASIFVKKIKGCIYYPNNRGITQ